MKEYDVQYRFVLVLLLEDQEATEEKKEEKGSQSTS
jgi:hypothetical protein